MSEPKTHRQRAEVAADLIIPATESLDRERSVCETIFNLTFPAELVEALNKATDEIEEAAEATQANYLFDLASDCRAVLALYEEKP